MVDDRRESSSAAPTEGEGERRAIREPAHNLPLPLDSLIGRERDLTAVTDLLSRCRLVTLVGPGGVGKTRLALAVASNVAATCRDGVGISDLTDAARITDVWGHVAEALRLEPDGGLDVARQVIAHVGSRHMLLVLESCEHLLEECAAVALSVTRECSGVSLLCTSRQPLGAPGERVWPLTGLATDAEPQYRRPTAADSPAVRLFVERALAHRPDFRLRTEERPVVAELCRRLDGLPVAIELAAARVRVLSPDEILTRLDDPLALLVTPSAATPARHRSLRANLDRSYKLLPDEEAVFFRRLAVFVGGFTLSAAEAVCVAPPLEEMSVLEVTASLVAKSLVLADTTDGESRYRLLQTVRAYAAARLEEAGDAGRIRERHAEWALGFAESAEPALVSTRPERWLARLAADQDNVQAALEWTVDAERTAWALRIASAMVHFWRWRRLHSVAKTWLNRTLAMPHQPAAPRTRALVALGCVTGDSGDRLGAIGPLAEAHRLAAKHGDDAAEAFALNRLGYFRLFLDVPTAAVSPLERSADMARAAGDARTALQSLASAGWGAMFGGDARLAEARFRECLAAAQVSEHRDQDVLPAVVGMGSALLARGRHREAEAALSHALTIAERMKSDSAVAMAQSWLADLARARGDHGQACVLLGDAVAQARESADPWAVAMRLALLGVVLHGQSDLERAEAALVEAVAVADAAGLPFAHARALVALGALRVTQGHPELGAPLLGEGSAVATAHEFAGVMAAALLEQARLRRVDDDLQGAARAVTEAIRVQDRLGDVPGLVDSLEVLGGVRAGQGRCRTACRLFGAAATARTDRSIARPPVQAAAYEIDVGLARGGLGPGESDASWAQGRSMSLVEVTAMAIAGTGRRDDARTGWNAITPTEREVVGLVAQGLTNREVAATLVISARTVETHVAHILAKVEISSRRELARVAATKGFGAPSLIEPPR